jgi:protein phosphatase
MANDIAPEVVVQRLPVLFQEILNGKAELSDPKLRQQIGVLLEQLNVEVHVEMAKHGELGLGATLVLALVRAGQALIVHLGDSRAYLFRDGELQQLTWDHSYFQELVLRGVISAAEAQDARFNGGPTRFLGMADEAEADFQLLQLHPRDRLLLCSDGLTGMLRDPEIGKILGKKAAPAQLCHLLVEAANEAGGDDNITALVIEFREE